MNLTKVEGTYSREIYANLPKLKIALNDDSMSLPFMKNFVRLIISQTGETAARTRFLDYLLGCQTKKEVLELCNNTVQKAMKYKPAKRTS